MKGRAQLSSRGCGAKVVQRRCLAARCMERKSTRGGESASHPKSKLAARPSCVAAITWFATSNLIPAYAWFQLQR